MLRELRKSGCSTVCRTALIPNKSLFDSLAWLNLMYSMGHPEYPSVTSQHELLVLQWICLPWVTQAGRAAIVGEVRCAEVGRSLQLAWSFGAATSPTSRQAFQGSGRSPASRSAPNNNNRKELTTPTNCLLTTTMRPFKPPSTVAASSNRRPTTRRTAFLSAFLVASILLLLNPSAANAQSEGETEGRSELVQQIERASNESLLWGPYKPNLYFGVAPRIPKSLAAGLLWSRVEDFRTVQESAFARPPHPHPPPMGGSEGLTLKLTTEKGLT